MNYAWVALGSAFGAIGRYALSMIAIKTEFPVMTFITNILGAVLIGFVIGLMEGRHELSPAALLFWKTGVCGGFTTFSTFSLEAFNLLEREAYLTGGLYMVLSVLLCVIGVACGRRIAGLIC